MQYKIINAISSASVPLWGNKKQYIAIHYYFYGQCQDEVGNCETRDARSQS